MSKNDYRTSIISLPLDENTVEKLENFCDDRGISVERFILNSIAEKIEDYGEHFFSEYYFPEQHLCMYSVYEVYTWDDVTYTKLSSHKNKDEAEKECERLRKENTFDAVSYCVMTDIQYYNLMDNN